VVSSKTLRPAGKRPANHGAQAPTAKRTDGVPPSNTLGPGLVVRSVSELAAQTCQPAALSCQGQRRPKRPMRETALGAGSAPPQSGCDY